MKNLYNKLFTITIALILASCSSNTEEAVVNEPASESIQEESNNKQLLIIYFIKYLHQMNYSQF